ncbi:MAG: hypothetical protein ACRDTM_16150 [Micromonosporaceae bacterium]
MHPRLAHDLTALPELLDATRALAVRALGGLHSRPVAARRTTPEPEPLPPRGVGLDGALERFTAR